MLKFINKNDGYLNCMNLKRDIIAALNLEEPEFIPVAPYIDFNYAPKLLGLKISDVILGSNELKAKVLINAFERHKYNWVMVWLNEPRNWLENTKIVDKGSRYELFDESGRLIRIIPKDDAPIYGSWYGFGDVKIDEAVEKLESEIEDYKSILMSGRCEVAKMVSDRVGDRALITGIISAPYGEVVCRLGLMEAMKCLLKNPNLIKKLSEITLERVLEEAKALVEVGVEALWIEEVFAGSDIISPKHFQEFALPYEKKLIEKLRSLNVYTILYFCGNPTPIIKDLITVNAHAYAFEEEKKNIKIDMENIRGMLMGKSCLFGNFDAIYTLRKTPKEIEEKVKEMIFKLAPGGGFIIGTGSPILKDIPPENIDTLIKTARTYSGKVR